MIFPDELKMLEERGTGYDDIAVTFKPILIPDNLLNVTNKQITSTKIKYR